MNYPSFPILIVKNTFEIFLSVTYFQDKCAFVFFSSSHNQILAFS